MNKEKIIITGALGQDGVILSKILLKKKYEVYGIVKKIYKRKLKNINYYVHNLKNYKKTSKIIKTINPDIVVHFGTDNPNYLELKRKKNFLKTNMLTTNNLINSLIKNEINSKIIIIGSSQMYGSTNKTVTESSSFNPKNTYAKFRVLSHHLLMEKKKINKLKLTNTILFNHDSKFRKKKFLLPRLINLIKNKNIKKITEIYNENISGDFSHAEDICEGIFKLITTKKNPNKIIFSSNKRTFINDVIDYLISLSKNKIKIKKNIKHKEHLSPIGSNKLAKRLLNWNVKKNIFIAAKELFLIK